MKYQNNTIVIIIYFSQYLINNSHGKRFLISIFIFMLLEKIMFLTGIPKSSLVGLTTSRISTQSNKVSSSNTSVSSTISG